MEQVVRIGGRQGGKTATLAEELYRTVAMDLEEGRRPRSIRMSQGMADLLADHFGATVKLPAGAPKATTFLGEPVTIDNTVLGVVIERSTEAA